ncbi:thioredoxin-like [Branchiostoma floridae x Branchiostoma japonicum]
MRFSQLSFGVVCLLVQIRVGYGVQYVESLEEFQKVLQDAGDKLAVVFFTAEWCGPCKSIGPAFEMHSTKSENAGVIFGKVDVDDASDISEFCGVAAMPTFVFFKQANEIDRFQGKNENTLEEKISKHR